MRVLITCHNSTSYVQSNVIDHAKVWSRLKKNVIHVIKCRKFLLIAWFRAQKVIAWSPRYFFSWPVYSFLYRNSIQLFQSLNNLVSLKISQLFFTRKQYISCLDRHHLSKLNEGHKCLIFHFSEYAMEIAKTCISSFKTLLTNNHPKVLEPV